MHSSALLAAAAILLAPAVQAGGLYPKSSPVMQVDAKSYAKLIEKSPYPSIVEFYAPWCGHCQNLKPAYEKAAKSLDGLANVAAVNCDDDDNKQFCGAMGVQGFPTLKLVRPSKKASGSPMVEDYRGERSAKAIVSAVTDAIHNHVKRLQDKDRDEFMESEGPKALLFSDKSTISATLKTIAIDFLDVISVAQVRNTQKNLVEEFGITEFPTLVLVPAEGDPIMYVGEMKKAAMVEFLSQAGSPRSSGGSKREKKVEKKAEKQTKAKESESQTSSEPEPKPSAEPEKLVSPIPVSTEPTEISRECLDMRSHICILALVPSPPGDDGALALDHMAEIYTRHKHAGRSPPKAFIVPKGNSAGDLVREKLRLPREVELVAINGRRGWWKHYNSIDKGYSQEAIEAWIDEIRMGEGDKLRVPSELLIGEDEEIVGEETKPEVDAGKEDDAEVVLEDEAVKEEDESVVDDGDDGDDDETSAEKPMPREHEEL